jgi:hypothetical protein
MTATPTRPVSPPTGPIDLTAETARFRWEARAVQVLIVALAGAVAAAEIRTDTTAAYLAVILLPFVLLGLATYGLGLWPAITRGWLITGVVVVATVAVGASFASWGPWFWSAGYAAALVPAVAAPVHARLTAK